MRTFILCLVFFFTSLSAAVFETTSIEEISAFASKDSLIIFDFDNTLVDARQPFGSKKWRDWVRVQIKKLEEDNEIPKALISKHLTNLGRFAVPMVPMEEEKTLTIIRNLKDIPLIILTSRPIDFLNDVPLGFAKMTVKQLNSSNIYLAPIIEIETYEGILFTCEQDKGSFLKTTLEKNNYFPKRILFVDNSLENILTVKKAAEELGIDFYGFHYLYNNPKWNNFDPLIANLQLEVFLKENRVPNVEEVLKMKGDLAAESHFKNLILSSYLEIINKSFFLMRTL